MPPNRGRVLASILSLKGVQW